MNHPISKLIFLICFSNPSTSLCRSGRGSESDLHQQPGKPAVMEKPALIKPLTIPTHPATDKAENSSSDPSGRRPNQILRIQSESDLLARQQQQLTEHRAAGKLGRSFDSEEEEEEEELKISLRVEGFQPTTANSSEVNNSNRSESKENLNPQRDQVSAAAAAVRKSVNKKFRPRNETNEKFLDMEPLPEPPPTPPPGSGGSSQHGRLSGSSSPIPIPRGRRSLLSVECDGVFFYYDRFSYLFLELGIFVNFLSPGR